MSSSHPADRVWLPRAATPSCPAQCLAQESSKSLETIRQLRSPSTNCRPQSEVRPRLKCSPEKVCLPVTHCWTVRSIQGACRPSDQNCCCTQTGKLPSREGKDGEATQPVPRARLLHGPTPCILTHLCPSSHSFGLLPLPTAFHLPPQTLQALPCVWAFVLAVPSTLPS